MDFAWPTEQFFTRDSIHCRGALAAAKCRRRVEEDLRDGDTGHTEQVHGRDQQYVVAMTEGRTTHFARRSLATIAGVIDDAVLPQLVRT
jgi:hypothetical protein